MLTSEYKPVAYVLDPNEDLDVDGTNDGDYVVCDVHQDVIVYVFGTGFWHKEGGESGFGWSSLPLNGWCYKCDRQRSFNVGSYGG
jgi:hypothetical protein